LVTDHFDQTPSTLFKFWVRSSSIGWISSACLLNAMIDLNLSHKFALTFVVASGVLYPWNAKFNKVLRRAPPLSYCAAPPLLMTFHSSLRSSPTAQGMNLLIIYKMHYVPEALLLVLTILGVAAGIEQAGEYLQLPKTSSSGCSTR